MSIDLESVYNNCINYGKTAYNRSGLWISNQYKAANAKLPIITAWMKKQAESGFKASSNFVLTYHTWIIGGTAIGIALLVIYRYWKNLPQLPYVKLKSTHNVATLSVKIPPAYPGILQPQSRLKLLMQLMRFENKQGMELCLLG